MTVQERLKELVEAGAIASVSFSDGHRPLYFLLGAAVWLQNPARLMWCVAFIDSGRGGHETLYDAVKLEAGGRDVGFYVGEELVLYVCPIEESGLDITAYRDTFIRWRNYLSEGTNAADFEEAFTVPEEE